MRCASCGFANAEGMHFCGRCGTKLSRPCPACGFANPADHRFRGPCGARLSAPAFLPSPAPQGNQHHQPEHHPVQVAPPAERRQLTVLFCDLMGSTALSAQFDPEDLREVVRAYQAVCAEVIHRFEGHIAQYLGNGLLVYFGYPLAHEDDPQRAVRTGLGIVEEMGRLNRRLEWDRGIRLAVRLGIHTGLVVVGEMGGGSRREQLALGETPNLAARLQGLAAPDTVVISAVTYRLVQGLFACQDLGSHILKGLSQPMSAYRVLRENVVHSRFEVAITTGLTPLVGRDQEVAVLLECWAQVQDGVGQVVVLSGEAGVGKSCLVQVVKDRVAS
jgi:class 3 adenylate cyclase